MAEQRQPTTAICAYTSDAIYVRDKSLVDELIGEVTFTQMMFFQIMGRMPTPAEVKIVDAVLVTLMEHGITPSATQKTAARAWSAMVRNATSVSASCPYFTPVRSSIARISGRNRSVS